MTEATVLEAPAPRGRHPSETAPVAARAALGRLLQLTVVALLYAFAGKLGLLLAFFHASATAVWPPTGIALATLLLLGTRFWPAIFAGAFLVNVTTQGSVVTSLSIAAGNTLEAVLGAYLVRRLAGGHRAFERGQYVFAFAGVAVAASAVAATIGVTSLATAGYVPLIQYHAVWLTWWLGDAVGAVIVTPLLLLWLGTSDVRWTQRCILEAFVLVIVTVVIALIVFGGLLASLGVRNPPMAFLSIPPLVWAAFRFGGREAATLMWLLSGIAITGTLREFGPFASPEQNESLLLLQAFMGTISVTTLSLGALMRERVRSDREERRLRAVAEVERARFEAVLRHLPAGVIIGEAPSGRLLLGNEQVERIWRHPFRASGSIEAYAAYLGFHADGRPYAPAEWPLARSVTTGEVVVGEEIEILRGDGTRTTISVSSAPIRDASGAIVAAVVIFHDIGAVKAAEARRDELLALEQARRAEAERASRAKDQFLAMLGHELRNPLAAIAGAAAVLERVDASKPDAVVARQIVARQVRHVARLVDDLLDVGRLTQGHIALRRQAVDLAEVAARAVGSIRAAGAADARRIAVEAEPTWVNGDPVRLEQVLTNLLANAVRHTPAGLAVTVNVRSTAGEAVVTVADEGSGISADLLPRIFEPFVQGHRGVDRAEGGLGIGLTLVRTLVELHGGRVDVRSDGEGRGSTFTVRLPSGPAGEAPARPAAGPSTSRRVLVVEDNADSAEMLRAVLQLQGHEVHVAHDGPSALATAARVLPEVALVDIGLPGLDGYDVARRIRAGANERDVLLVAITGYGQPEDRRRTADAGFDVHLVKPVDPDRLMAVFSSARMRSS